MSRTQNFKNRIEVERQVLSVANSFSQKVEITPLYGLSQDSIDNWLAGFSQEFSPNAVEEIEATLKHLSRSSGLLADQSRCAVAEGKVPSNIPSLCSQFSIQISSLLNK